MIYFDPSILEAANSTGSVMMQASCGSSPVSVEERREATFSRNGKNK
jgi:hypothetical protein